MNLGELVESGYWVNIDKNTPSDFGGNKNAYGFILRCVSKRAGTESYFLIDKWIDNVDEHLKDIYSITHWKPFLKYSKGLVLMNNMI